MVERPIAILEAPSILGLFPRGVETLPEALLGAGLAERLGASLAGRVEPPPYDPERDPSTQLLNPSGIAHYSVELADRVTDLFSAGHLPVVLGGDCSILLGCLLALRRRGRSGLLFLDGHADFYQPAAEPSGEVASMELAIATGRGPKIVTNLERRRPLLREENVVAFGRRDGPVAEADGSQRIEDTAITLLDLAAVRAAGIERATTTALARLTAPDLAGFWIHFDVDVLNDEIMPAVDYRLPDGLSWQECDTVLDAAFASGRAAGISVTIFNPTLDPDGSLASRLTALLGDTLRPSR